MPSGAILNNKIFRPAGVLALVALSAVIFLDVLAALLALALRDERYTYIIVMPFLCVTVMVLNRAAIFRKNSYSIGGIPLLALGFWLHATLAPDRLTDPVLGEVTKAGIALTAVWCGIFVSFFGLHAARQALFPLSMLLLTTPPPAAWLNSLEAFLQRGSAEFAYVMFKLTGMPVFRQDMVFSLPGIDIEVARECSGIRSALALLVTALMAGYLLLRSNVNRTALVLLSLPISMFKNAVRITVLSWLGVYVSPDYLHGDLHRHGGLPFTLIALAMVLPVLLILLRIERRQASPPSQAPPGLSSPTPSPPSQ